MSPRPSAGTAVTPGLDVERGTRHLRRKDPVMRELIKRIGKVDPEGRRRGRPADAYGALLRSIVGQQLSTKAARSIYGRVAGLYGDRTPSPQELLDTDRETLRGAGLSRAKVEYMRSLAEHVLSGELELDRLDELPDEEVSAALTAVKGLGQWTADMFLIFHMGRPDVLPVGDLGVRNAARAVYELKELPTAPELTAIAEPWRPHRSLASLYLWRSLDNEPA
ncbi:MAG: DNA-3-methyladenine glycosylase [Thermoleophilaceae bacterium]|nr:DNA-3-methyladenine glycosylase [Thermoleophilaceae bacterium]